MKKSLLLIQLVLLLVSNIANAQGYSYYNSSQYRYNNAVYQQNLYNSQINSYKPAGYGTYSTPNSYGSYGSYNYNSYTPSYNSDNTYSSSTVTESHYSSSKIVFCESVNDGEAEGVYSSFVVSDDDGSIKIYLTNYKGLATNLLLVDIYKEENGDYTFKKRRKVNISSTFTRAWFSQDFSEFGEGNYKVSIYNEDNIYINSGYVNILIYTEDNKAYTNEDEEELNSFTSTSLSPVTSSTYYQDSKIYFFEDESDFNLEGTGRNSLYLNLGYNEAHIEVTNDKAFNTSELLVSIKKKDSYGIYQPYDKKEFTYDDVTSKHYYFTYNFEEEGYNTPPI